MTMASNKIFTCQSLIIYLLYLHVRSVVSSNLIRLPDIRLLRSCKIDKIYQLGDSLSDTGNHNIEDPFGKCSRPPYGQSFFPKPSGRCSDGLLMIDYIASAARINFLNPYLNSTANFTHGANFAVVGSTAMSVQTLADNNISSPASLDVQLDWMSAHLSFPCHSKLDCRPKKLENALFMVGETGGNDYNYALLQGKSIEEVKEMVPEVVQVIKNAIRRVIEFGAVRVVVPGNLPMGCIPVFLTLFQFKNPTAYDEHKCLNFLNEFSTYHNIHLQQAITALQEEYRNISIVYADYYNAFLWLLHNSRNLGFDDRSTLKACCGTGGIYNFSPTRMCGTQIVPVCSRPDRYISWDGMHLTQKAYESIAQWLIADLLPKLNCNINISYY